MIHLDVLDRIETPPHTFQFHYMKQKDHKISFKER